MKKPRKLRIAKTLRHKNQRAMTPLLRKLTASRDGTFRGPIRKNQKRTEYF